jgi:hypothetical protein
MPYKVYTLFGGYVGTTAYLSRRGCGKHRFFKTVPATPKKLSGVPFDTGTSRE